MMMKNVYRMIVASNMMLMMIALQGLFPLLFPLLWRTDIGTLAYQPTITVTPATSTRRTSLFVSTTTVSSMDEYDSQISSEVVPFESSHIRRRRRRRVSPYTFPASQHRHPPKTLPAASLDLLELPRHTATTLPTETSRTMLVSSLEVGLGRMAMVAAIILLLNECMTGQSFADQMVLYGGGIWDWMLS